MSLNFTHLVTWMSRDSYVSFPKLSTCISPHPPIPNGYTGEVTSDGRCYCLMSFLYFRTHLCDWGFRKHRGLESQGDRDDRDHPRRVRRQDLRQGRTVLRAEAGIRLRRFG